MGNWVRRFKFTYEDVSRLTGLTHGALRQRLKRGLDLHDLEVMVDFINKNKKEDKKDE